jgi:hypothetical protein
MLTRQTLCFLSLFVIGGLLIAPEPACGQADEEGPPPATHSEWAVGIQISPVLGLSVRWAATSRLTLQAAALPGLGGNFQGTVGGRGLYKFVRNNGYNVYASAGVAPFFGRRLQFTDDLSVKRRTEAVWYVTGTIGGEAAMGDHFGLSGEVGGARIVDPAGSGLIVPTFGVGLHYYW